MEQPRDTPSRRPGTPSPERGGDIFVVDNSDTEWKVERYLRDWTEIANSIDIATGFFEIGALLALDGEWQQLDKIRILMDDQVSARTKSVLSASRYRHQPLHGHRSRPRRGCGGCGGDRRRPR